MSRRRAEGLQQWVSLWNLGLCSGDGLYSLMNELVVSSTGSRLTRRGGGVVAGQENRSWGSRCGLNEGCGG